MKRIVFTVTNQLNHDQRMIRICTSMQQQGYWVTLVGVQHMRSNPLVTQPFLQKRLFCFFQKGFLFYAEYNIRLFFYLLTSSADILCCIDLDTMLPVYYAGKITQKKLVYDAHEYFSQQKEIITRPFVYKFWHWIERRFMPSFKNGYTVSQSIAEEFSRLYGLQYQVIRNVPVLMQTLNAHPTIDSNKIILYQGAVNEARGLEYLIPAMNSIDATLHIYGTGNFVEQTRTLIKKNKLEHKVILKGNVLPADLKSITQNAYLGINLVENTGKNQYFSLANKFFDYMHAAVPQVTMDFPEYQRVNNVYEIAVLVKELTESNIIKAINQLLQDQNKYHTLQSNCIKASHEHHWGEEEKKLIAFYKNIE